LLQASYTFSLPYASTVQTQGLSFPVHMWVDADSQRMRVDVFGGMDSTITLQVRPAAAAAGMQGWPCYGFRCAVKLPDHLYVELCMAAQQQLGTSVAVEVKHLAAAARGCFKQASKQAALLLARWLRLVLQHQWWLLAGCCSLPAGHLLPAVPAHQCDSVRHHQG
jgi:hypothetical protein